jgi:hypothetical protein
VLRADYLHQPVTVEDAMGVHALALLSLLDTACTNAERLAEAAATAFRAHPDAAIIASFPGQGELTGARILGELGDDPTRFTDARGLKAYAGSAPITRASGRVRSVTTRRIKNQRLAAAGYVWAFSALTASPGARAHYDRRRSHGDSHVAAQRNLFNRLLGCLHHCLATGTRYDETIVLPHHANQTRDCRRLTANQRGMSRSPSPVAAYRGVAGRVPSCPRWSTVNQSHRHHRLRPEPSNSADTTR